MSTKTRLTDGRGRIIAELIDGRWQYLPDPAVAPEPEPVPVVLLEPSIPEMAHNFTSALSGWARAGFPVVDEPTYQTRAAICEACSFWDGSARLGLGKCRHHGCGCTVFKRWLATARCPIQRWPEDPSQAGGGAGKA